MEKQCKKKKGNIRERFREDIYVAKQHVKKIHKTSHVVKILITA
jgi:hypothetical protein